MMRRFLMKEPAKKVEETSQKDIHLYTAPTMNGWKPVIFLEEAGIEYDLTYVDFSKNEGWHPQGLVGSPITGPAGNHEYILWLGIGGIGSMPNVKDIVDKTLGLKG